MSIFMDSGSGAHTLRARLKRLTVKIERIAAATAAAIVATSTVAGCSNPQTIFDACAPLKRRVRDNDAIDRAWLSPW